MLSERTFNRAALQHIEIERPCTAPRARDVHCSSHRCDEFFIPPGLQDEIRRALLESLNSERDASKGRHQHDSQGRIAGVYPSERIEPVATATRAGREVHVEQNDIVLTFLSLVVGELVPKRFALAHSDAIASHVSPAIKAIARIAHPAVTLLQLSTEGVLRFFGVQSQARATAQVIRRDDGSWLVDAQVELQDLERSLGAGGLATGSTFMTLAGLILEQLGRIPEVGEILVVNGWRLEVVDLDGHRIDKVIVTRLPGRAARV